MRISLDVFPVPIDRCFSVHPSTLVSLFFSGRLRILCPCQHLPCGLPICVVSCFFLCLGPSRFSVKAGPEWQLLHVHRLTSNVQRVLSWMVSGQKKPGLEMGSQTWHRCARSERGQVSPCLLRPICCDCGSLLVLCVPSRKTQLCAVVAAKAVERESEKDRWLWDVHMLLRHAFSHSFLWYVCTTFPVFSFFEMRSLSLFDTIFHSFSLSLSSPSFPSLSGG